MYFQLEVDYYSNEANKSKYKNFQFITSTKNNLKILVYLALYLQRQLFILCSLDQDWRHQGGHGSPTFLRGKKEKGRQRQKRRKGFKAETIKRLSPRSKYHCFSHSTASRIRKFFLSANHGGQQYFSVFHDPPPPSPKPSPHFEIHFAGPVDLLLLECIFFKGKLCLLEQDISRSIFISIRYT